MQDSRWTSQDPCPQMLRKVLKSLAGEQMCLVTGLEGTAWFPGAPSLSRSNRCHRFLLRPCGDRDGDSGNRVTHPKPAQLRADGIASSMPLPAGTDPACSFATPPPPPSCDPPRSPAVKPGRACFPLGAAPDSSLKQKINTESVASELWASLEAASVRKLIA